MRRILSILAVITILAAFPCHCAMAGTKMDKRIDYTLRNMKLDKQTQTSFEPMLRQYLTEKKEATKAYEDLKDKYKSAKKAGTLTDKQATQLLNAKLAADAAEIKVKIKWRTEFAKVLSPKQIFYAFDYSGDKMSKIEGRDSDD